MIASIRAPALRWTLAVLWYEQRVAGLGAGLVSELERAIARIAEAPNAWPLSDLDGRARRLSLPRFPYSLIDVVTAYGDVVIAAVIHVPSCQTRPRGAPSRRRSTSEQRVALRRVGRGRCAMIVPQVSFCLPAKARCAVLAPPETFDWLTDDEPRDIVRGVTTRAFGPT